MSGSYFPSYSISYGFEMGGAVTIVFFVLALAAAIALVALFLPRNTRVSIGSRKGSIEGLVTCEALSSRRSQ